MNNRKLLIIGVVAFIVIVLGVAGGLFLFNSANKASKQAQFDNCMKEANNNQAIYDKVNTEFNNDTQKCIRDYIKAQGYTDNINCIQDYNNPICKDEKYDANGTNIGRYNAEVNGTNSCNKTVQSVQSRLDATTYKSGVSQLSCLQYQVN